jgi:alanine dehydrogenase
MNWFSNLNMVSEKGRLYRLDILLLMPSWQQGGLLGLKMTMVCPENHQYNLETIQSTYILSDATTGILKAVMDGDELTARRTACASALASSYLSIKNAKNLLMVGTGKLIPHLIIAHTSVRDIEKIFIWGRNQEKSRALATHVQERIKIPVIAINDLEEYLPQADIISCATLSKEPILKEEWLRRSGGQHIDLVGSFTAKMRETDNGVMQKSKIYVDTFSGALAEAGDILQPIEDGVITKDNILGDLYDLTKSDQMVRKNDFDITLFKSVGTALEDLIAAKYAYEKHLCSAI